MTATPGMPAWATLEQALVARRPVALRYHGHDRVVCPHALGWKAGRARVLSYQVEGTTSTGTLSDHPNQRWRCLFVDEIEAACITDGPWHSAANYSPTTANGIDELAMVVDV